MSKVPKTTVARKKPRLLVEAFEHDMLAKLETFVLQVRPDKHTHFVQIGDLRWSIVCEEWEMGQHSDYDEDWTGFGVITASVDAYQEHIKYILEFTSYRGADEPVIAGGIAAAKLVEKVPVTKYDWKEIQ